MIRVKKTAEYSIYKRRDNRFAVKDQNKQPVNGDKKIEILQAEGYLKQPEPKPAAETSENTESSEESENSEE